MNSCEDDANNLIKIIKPIIPAMVPKMTIINLKFFPIDLFRNLTGLSQVPLELAAYSGKFPVFFGEVVRKLRFSNNSDVPSMTFEDIQSCFFAAPAYLRAV
jgi:hypothetical protein